MDGFLNMLKPPGMSSGDVVIFVRRRLPRGTRVGHGGTLDPDAAGVLPVCVGKAARLFDYIVDKRKTYIAELRLGISTDTQDAGGQILSRRDASRVAEDDVKRVLPRFVGDIDQIPPIYSALKRDGKKLCDLARKGETVELEPRRVHVESIDCLGAGPDNTFRLKIVCGRGAYIRTLCHDIGEALGVGGHMAFLLRSEAGCFSVRQAVTLEEFRQTADEGRIETLLSPLDAPLAHIRAVTLGGRFAKQVENGVAIRPEWHGQSLAPGETVRVYLENSFAGMAQADETGLLKFRAMLLEKN